MTNNQEQEIRALYSHIPLDVQAVFEEYYEAQLREALDVANAQAQGTPLGAADRTAVEAELIEELLFRADGRDNPQGIGYVPSPGGGYDVTPPTQNPFEATPTDDTDGPIRQGLSRRGRFFMMIGILAVGVPLVCLAFASAAHGIRSLRTAQPPVTPSRAASPQPSDPNVASQQLYGTVPTTGTTPLADVAVRNAKVTYPSGLEIMLGQTDPVTDTALLTTSAQARWYDVVPVGGQPGRSWKPTVQEGTAAWRTDSYINAIFCLPADAESLLRQLPEGTVVLMRRVTSDVRQYQIVRVRQVGRQQTEVSTQLRGGLTLLACGTDGETRVIAEAVYVPPISRERPPLAVQGNTVPGYVEAKVTDITAQSRSDTVVQVNIGVAVRNLSRHELQWTDLSDQLIANGEAAQPAARVDWPALAPDRTQTATYSYLVPRGTQETQWQVIAPTGETMAVQIVVPTVQP